MTARPLVVCGPSGVGKGTLLKKLFEEFPRDFGFGVSHTTRKPREGEVHGKHYFFTDRETMLADAKAGKFIETAEFAGNMYGTSIATVKEVMDKGRICVLEIDLQGAKSVAKIPELNARFMFIRPVSYEVLEQRLRGRGTETEDKIGARLRAGKEELAFLDENPAFFEKVIVNDDLDTAYGELKAYIASFHTLKPKETSA